MQKLARDALSANCPLSQVDELVKTYFLQWINDKQLVPSLVEQSKHKEFRYLKTMRRNSDVILTCMLATAMLLYTTQRRLQTSQHAHRAHSGIIHQHPAEVSFLTRTHLLPLIDKAAPVIASPLILVTFQTRKRTSQRLRQEIFVLPHGQVK